ncbi:MAG: phosphate propanoyltransferase [Patescibacteria group bacterium]|jgi:putative phosphotransacetylase
MIIEIPVEISARHIHLSREHLDALFGAGYELNNLKELSQKGQFATSETIIIQTEKDKIEKVRILGPVRKQTQVEISKTDAKKLGINPPIRHSGDLSSSAGCILIGPKGTVLLKEGIIIAWRHIHATPKYMQDYNLDSRKFVSVKISTPSRTITFHQVYLHVDPSFTPVLCLDTDEANAAGIEGLISGEVILD